MPSYLLRVEIVKVNLLHSVGWISSLRLVGYVCLTTRKLKICHLEQTVHSEHTKR